MKNKFILFMVCLLLAATLVIGCSKKEEPPLVEAQTEEPNEVGVSVTIPIVKETIEETEAEKTITETEETEPEPEPETIKTVEELAQEVIDGWYGNGPDREAALGDRYKEVQEYIDENYKPSVPAVSYTEDDSYYYEDSYYPSGSGVLTPGSGINYYYGVLETYYNLPMGGVIDIMYSLGYDYEYWVRGDGVKMFGPYVIVAADFGWLPRGSVIETSLGTGMVCDTGAGGWYWTDIATAW